MSDWYQRQFGDRASFAISVSLGPDPHPNGDEVHSAAWGEFELWANGECLTRSISEGAVQTGVRWSLLPLLEWLLQVSARLVNEDPFPRFSRGIDVSDASMWFDATINPNVVDPVQEQHWFDRRSEWRQFHAIRRAAQDAALPNIVFKRHGDSMEISWDNESWGSSRKSLLFVAQRGRALVSAQSFAAVLQDALRDVTSQLACRSNLEPFAELRERASLLQAAKDDWRWLVHRNNARIIKSSLPSLCEKLDENVLAARKGIFVPHTHETHLLRLVRLESADEIERLLRSAERILSVETVSHTLAELVRPTNAASHRPWEEGNEYAEFVRERLDWGDGALPELSAWLRGQGVLVADEDLGLPASVSLLAAREDGHTGLHVNPNGHSSAKRETGIATALGHVLMDREVFSADGDWEHWPTAARARAFGVALLLPEEGVKKSLIGKTRVGVEEVRDLMQQFRVGPLAATYRLKNLSLISDDEQQELAAKLAA